LKPARSWILPAAAGIAITIAATLAFNQEDQPTAVSDLQRAQEAGARAGSAGERIVANLERIEENLQAGAGISEKSDEIHDLTTRQRRSLENLVGLLREQLDTLEKTKRSLERTRDTAASVGRLGAKQLAILRRTLGSLERLRGNVVFATRTSGELARLAVYGARLAEDSQRRFSGGP
jgi:hypothetical protein